MHRQLAVLGQQQDAGAGELFGHRTDGEDGVGGNRAAILQRTFAITLGEDHAAIFYDRDRPTHPAGLPNLR